MDRIRSERCKAVEGEQCAHCKKDFRVGETIRNTWLEPDRDIYDLVCWNSYTCMKRMRARLELAKLEKEIEEINCSCKDGKVGLCHAAKA